MTHGALPQFSELTSRSSTVSTSKFTSSDNTQAEQTTVTTTAAGLNQTKQNLLVRFIIVSSSFIAFLLNYVFF